jgi:hypothetical protein
MTDWRNVARLRNIEEISRSQRVIHSNRRQVYTEFQMETFLQIINTIAVIALYVLVLGVWKPWVSAYSREKGKNLARKEDLDAILAEVRAVTLTQKEIEHKLSGDLWNEQTRRTEKKDLYAQIIRAINELSDSLDDAEAAVETSKTQVEPSSNVELQLLRSYNEGLSRIRTLTSELHTLFALSFIYTDEECARALSDYIENQQHCESVQDTEWLKNNRALLRKTKLRVVATAKIDLGLIKAALPPRKDG